MGFTQWNKSRAAGSRGCYMKKLLSSILFLVAAVVIFLLVTSPLTLYSQRTTPTLILSSSSVKFQYSTATWVGAQGINRAQPAVYVDNKKEMLMDSCVIINAYTQNDEAITVYECTETLSLSTGTHTVGVIAMAWRASDAGSVAAQCGGDPVAPAYYSDGLCSGIIEADKVSGTVTVGASSSGAPSPSNQPSTQRDLPTGDSVQVRQPSNLASIIQSFIDRLRGWFR